MGKEFIRKLYISHQECPTCPTPLEISQFFSELMGVLFPDFTRLSSLSEDQFGQLFIKLQNDLSHLLKHNQAKGITANQISERFFDALPVIVEKLHRDIAAMYEG